MLRDMFLDRPRVVMSLLEYSRSIKPTAESTAEVQISFYGIQVFSYLLPIRHWTWRYITIINSWVFSLQLLGTHWPTYAYLLTITIVTYLVLSLLFSIDQRPSGT